MEEWDALLVVFRKSEGPSVVRASYSARELEGRALVRTTRLMLVAFNGFWLVPVAGPDCWSPTAESRSHSRPAFSCPNPIGGFDRFGYGGFSLRGALLLVDGQGQQAHLNQRRKEDDGHAVL